MIGVRGCGADEATISEQHTARQHGIINDRGVPLVLTAFFSSAHYRHINGKPLCCCSSSFRIFRASQTSFFNRITLGNTLFGSPRMHCKVCKCFLGQSDLSPIENLWVMIGCRLNTSPLPRNEDELWGHISNTWCTILQDMIRTLIGSMQHVQECTARKGAATSY